MIEDNKQCVALLRRVNKKAVLCKGREPVVRALLLAILLERVVVDLVDYEDEEDYYEHEEEYGNDPRGASGIASDIAFSLDRERNIATDIVHDLDLGFDLELAIDLFRGVGIHIEENDLKCRLTSQQYDDITDYLEACLLLVECLNLASVSNRAGIEAQLLLPPETSMQAQ
jgi:hypothetical protein